MKYFLFILLLAFLFVPSLFSQQTVTIASTNITLEETESFDLTASGKWFIQFANTSTAQPEVWYKLGKTLYPDISDRTQAVIDAQALVITNLNTYVKEAIESANYTAINEGTGLVLSSQTSITYDFAYFKDGKLFQICVSNDGKNCLLALYPDLTQETSAATTARANIVTQLAIIDSAANTGNHYE